MKSIKRVMKPIKRAILNLPVFSAEQELLFQTRYEEGYDLPDLDYHQWLTIHHPESVSAEQPCILLHEIQ